MDKRKDIRLLKMMCVAFLTFMSVPETAMADGLDGEYSVGSQSVTVTLKSWGDDCGPKPQSYTKKGKGTVTVSEKGDHLFFSNGRSTKKCWSANPKLQRLSVTKKANTWTIVCESPSTDSRYEHGKYVVTAGGAKITVKDTSKYNWKLKDSVCQATIVIKRSFTKIGGEDEPLTVPDDPPEDEKPPEEDPSTKPHIDMEYPEPPPPEKCKTPGPPVKFILVPASAKTTPGRKVCFTAFEVDKNGCRSDVGAQFKLIKEKSDRAGRMDGHCFIPGDSAATSEGKFRISASHGYDTATAKVVVLSDFIDDLIAVNLDPMGEGENVEDPVAVPGQGDITDETVDVPVPGKKKPPLFLLYVLPPSFLLVLLLVVVVVAVRQRKKRLTRRIADLEERRLREASGEGEVMGAPEPMQDAEDDGQPARQRRQAHLPRTGDAGGVQKVAEPGSAGGPKMICRVCGREYHGGSKFCPHDGSALVLDDGKDEEVHESGMICPRCGRGYAPGTRNCGEDGELLVPAPVADSGLDRTGVNPPRGTKLICPVCSQVYNDESTFCGKDGVKLVPMN